MTALEELRQHGAFPGGLVNYLESLHNRIAALEADKAAREAAAAPAQDTPAQDTQTDSGEPQQ